MSCKIIYNNQNYTIESFKDYLVKNKNLFLQDFISQDIEGFKEFVNNEKRKIGTNEFRDTESNDFIETEQNNKYLHQEIKESGGDLLWTSSEGYRYSANSLQELRGFTEKDAKSSDFKKENDRMGALSFRFSPNSSNFDNYLQSSYEEIWKEASKINNLEANIIASTFIAQQISEPTNKFYGRILSRIRESFGVQANGNISLEDDTAYFYVDDKNSISINLYRIGQYMSKFKSFNSFQKDLENTLNEESIHLAINNLATDKEMLQIFEEMTPSQIKDVKEIYKSIESVEKEDDKINLAHEFIRMIIQNKYTGEITESSNPTLFNIINRLLTKVKEWLGTEAIKTNEILNRFDNLVNIKEKNNTYFSITPEVDFNLKATQILSSQKANQVFEKGKKAGWTLDKILTELQIPKEQKQLILDLEDNDFSFGGLDLRESIITSLLANYSYTVEINTAKDNIKDVWVDEYSNKKIGDYITIDNQQWKILGTRFEDDSWGKSGLEQREAFIVDNEGEPTQHYSNLTVPGGTNGSYREQNFETPLIKVPKSHAQFNTENTIGFSRNDDRQIYTEKDVNSLLEVMQKSGILEIKC